MINDKKMRYKISVILISIIFFACNTPSLVQRTENKNVPSAFNNLTDSFNTVAKIKWQDFFTDKYLIDLIETGLTNNQELNITLQEIIIFQNEIRARKGEYLPKFGVGVGAGFEKTGRYTRRGAVEENLQIAPGRDFPQLLPDYLIGMNMSWEIDIWKKLRNGKNAAVARYLASIEGKNFLLTQLVAEIANSYYTLLTLDKQLDFVNQNIELQSDAFEVVKLEKKSATVTELAVRRFEAQLLHTKSLQYEIQQRIIETENNINFLLGRFPQPIKRNAKDSVALVPKIIAAGIPSQLLQNRPDIKKAELELVATKLDVKSARANFYPSLRIDANIGYQAFNPSFLFKPESILYNIAGGLMMPLINRNAIKAAYYSANARQLQSVFNYERTILNAYTEVFNQLANSKNLEKNYNLKYQQVQALLSSIQIAGNLFKSARADYMEVLLTQRDALEAKIELLETGLKQMQTTVNIYKSLGGGWN